jgi:hypothetical protein
MRWYQGMLDRALQRPCRTGQLKGAGPVALMLWLDGMMMMMQDNDLCFCLVFMALYAV